MQTLYYGGDILTMKNKADAPEAVLIDNGKIRFVGALEKARTLCNETVQKRDLKGKTLMPSFIDAHSHISVLAQFSEAAVLTDCTSFDEIVQDLKKYKVENNIGIDGVIFGTGYDHNFLKEGCHPDKFLLDTVSKDIPVIVMHTSLHMGVVNSAFLKLAGIDENSDDPAGGKFGRVSGSREPNGYLEEASALFTVLPAMYARLKMKYSDQIIKAQNVYLANGITTVQDGAATLANIKSITATAAAEQLKIDVVSYILAGENPDKIIQEYPKYDRKYHNRLKIGGYKLVLDGSPQGKSAWLTKPYEGEKEYRGYPYMDDSAAENIILDSLNGNFQILTHCNGDAAGDQFIRCYKKALEKSSNPNKNNLRPVMIHCQTARYDQLDEMVRLNMIPSIFVAHTYFWGDVHLKNLGPERGNRISPVKSALDRGLKLNFHQDSPVIPPDIILSIWAAVNRLTRTGVLIGGEERIDVYDALLAVTANAAYEYFEEDSKGTLEKGKLADMIILDKNPLKVDKMDIKNIKVLETIKEGKTLYSK